MLSCLVLTFFSIYSSYRFYFGDGSDWLLFMLKFKEGYRMKHVHSTVYVTDVRWKTKRSRKNVNWFHCHALYVRLKQFNVQRCMWVSNEKKENFLFSFIALTYQNVVCQILEIGFHFTRFAEETEESRVYFSFYPGALSIYKENRITGQVKPYRMLYEF